MTSLVLRAGHASTRAMAFRPDGKVLATCAPQEASIHFWRVHDGVLLGTFSGHSKMSHFKLSQNRLLSYGQSLVRLWRTTAMDERGFDFELLAEYGADTETLVLTTRHFLFRQVGGKVALGDIHDGKIKHAFPEARWFCTGGRGRRVLMGAEKSHLFSGVSARLVGELEVGCALGTFSPEDRWLACAGLNDCKVTLVDTETLKIWPIEAHRQRVLYGAFSTDGLWFASVAEDASLCLLNLEDWRMSVFTTQLGPAVMLHWLGGNRVVVGDAAGAYQLFLATRGGARAYPKQTCPAASAQHGLTGHWCAGPDSLAAWAPMGKATEIVNLTQSTSVSRLAPPLRADDVLSQRLVGRAILVGSQPWSLESGRPLSAEGEVHEVSNFLVGRRGARHQMLDGFTFQAPPASNLLAISSQADLFAFFQPQAQLLQVFRRQVDQLLLWRSLELSMGEQQTVLFSPDGQLLAFPEGPAWRVWLLDSNLCQSLQGRPLFLPEGGWVNPHDHGLECWSGQGQRLDQRPTQGTLTGLQRSPAGYLVVANDHGVQLLGLDLKQQMGSLNISDIQQFSVSQEGKWLFVLHRDARVSVWSLPGGVRLGEPRQFENSDLKSMKLNSGHGWLLASAGGKCGCWHLESGSFEWLDYPERWMDGVYPLAGGRVLQLTQGAWHLYAGPPLQRIASLRTTAQGGWIVTASDGRWDSSPELSECVWQQNGPELQPAPTIQRYDSLWASLLVSGQS